MYNKLNDEDFWCATCKKLEDCSRIHHLCKNGDEWESTLDYQKILDYTAWNSNTSIKIWVHQAKQAIVELLYLNKRLESIIKNMEINHDE